jgi:putative flavoprotein involved in K+ transport
MPQETVETLIIGAGQSGLAMSAHLTGHGLPHLVVERARIAEKWRTARWDSLVANGPAWHDRVPALTFADVADDDFAPKDSVVAYFETLARETGSPVRTGVDVTGLYARADGFRAETRAGGIQARNVVLATGPFQRPVIPTVIPADAGVAQLHSADYRNPDQLPPGPVLVVGAGSSGAQIADELTRAGRRVFLSIGPHDRPPRRYRGRDFVWWLGVLGKWDTVAPKPGTEHVTIAVSGAQGGETVDFRRFAARGITLLGRAGAWRDGVLEIADDLARNIRAGDANHLAVLDEADAWAAAQGLDLPPDPGARDLLPDPDCMTHPRRRLDLRAEGIAAVVWATGYALDYSWVHLDAFAADGRPVHHRGVSRIPGLYFLGLPWLTCRGSAFIWGSWRDAGELAGHIAQHRRAT